MHIYIYIVINISIQALYDYKKGKERIEVILRLFQFKHCTIIRNLPANGIGGLGISIQALYDYKNT